MTRILVADDTPDIRIIAESMLQIKGNYDVATANDGQEAIGMLVESHEKQMPYDAVITDIVMPRKDGLAVLDYIRQNSGSLPVVVMSGSADDEQIKYIASKNAYFIKKPFDNMEFLEIVVQALENGSANRI